MSIADPHVSPPDSPPYFHTLTPPASPNQLETLRLHPKRMLSMSHSAPNIAALVKATKPGKSQHFMTFTHINIGCSK